jgi:hypothetical protein
MKNEHLQFLAKVKKQLRVTKVVATRSVKGRHGDSFAGFSAGWESIQDDAGGPGADLIDGGISNAEIAPQGMSIKEATAAHYLLAMHADIAATEAAVAGGNMHHERGHDLIATYRKNYGRLLLNLLGDDDVPG